ncbi:MAG: SDR family NAD(P)-dependent oxidoreductase [Gemmatimonadota bacterium]
MARDDPSHDPAGLSKGDPERPVRPGHPGPPGHPVIDEVEVLEELLAQVVEETQPKPAPWFADLRGRGAIVTGAATGIGRATALELARHGVNVAFNYVGDGTIREEAQRTALELRQLEVKVLHRECDVRDADDVDAFVAAAREELGRIDILVNNAGVARDRALWRMSDEDWEAVLGTNLTGAFHMIRAVSPDLRRQQDGKIVNICSVHGIRPEFGLANYAASKAGLVGLTRSAAVELGPSNVNVNAIAPGYIRTTRLTDGVPAEILDRAREQSVLGRLGGPQDVAHVVLFLCSEQARHITGALIPVDGGHLL